MITIYSDGACRGNPGDGGWGALLISGTNEKSICGGERNTTNNRMELLAVIKALEIIKQPSDSLKIIISKARVNISGKTSENIMGSG